MPFSRQSISERGNAALLLVVVLMTYAPAMTAGYIWDDDHYVAENVHLRTTDGLGRIWFTPGATPQYYPLVFSTFWVEHKSWGLHPAGYHLVNIVLHGINSVLLFRALSVLRVPGSLFAAALFAVAPLNVESVAWVSERKNVLSGLLYLLAFLSYWKFTSRLGDEPAFGSAARWRDYAISLLLFGCALMSKSVTCSLPAAILLVLWWKRGRVKIRDVALLLPMFAIGIAAGVHTIFMEKHHVGAQGVDWEWSLIERCLIAGRVLWFYPLKLIWPDPLIFVYPKWQIDASVWWQSMFGVSFVGRVIWLWLARGRLGRGPLTAVLFYAGTLFPALGFISVYPMRFSFVADHFAYLASIGVIALFAATTVHLSNRRRWSRSWSRLAATMVVMMFSLVSFLRCFDYKDAESLWVATLADNPRCWMATFHLAAIRFDQQRFIEAATLFENALRHEKHDRPGHHEQADLHHYLGDTLLALGSPDESDFHFRQAVAFFQEMAEVEKESIVPHNNLGILSGKLKQPDQALRHFQAALEIEPADPDVNQNLGELYYRLKRFDESAECFHRVIEVDALNARAHYNLGTVTLTLGQKQEAIQHLQTAIRISPDFVAAQIVLQQAMSQTSGH